MITSVGAVEVYDLEPDTVPKFSLMASGYEVAAASTEAQMDELLADLGLGVSSPDYYTLGWYFDLLIDKLGFSTGTHSNLTLYLDWLLNDFANNRLGFSTTTTLSTYLDQYLYLLGDMRTSPPVYSIPYYLNIINSSVEGTTAAVEDTTAAVEDTTAAVQTFHSSFLSYLSIPAGTTISGIYGQDTSFNTSTSFSNLFNYFSRGLLFQFYVPASTQILGNTGQLSTITTGYPFRNLVNNGFRGLAYVLRGTNYNSSYDSFVTDNDGTERSFTSVGLGPMVHDLLNEVASDTGLLTYIFASPEDLKMKHNSESAVGAVTDNFISPSSDTSVSVSDIGTLSSAAGSIESFGSTGVTPDQAFAQLGNDSIFEFFSQTTADNLDSRSSSYSFRDPAPQIVTDYYSESRAEFFNLIGEGSE